MIISCLTYDWSVGPYWINSQTDYSKRKSSVLRVLLRTRGTQSTCHRETSGSKDLFTSRWAPYLLRNSIYLHTVSFVEQRVKLLGADYKKADNLWDVRTDHWSGRWLRSGWQRELVKNPLLGSAQDQMKLPSITHCDGIGTYVTGCHRNNIAALQRCLR